MPEQFANAAQTTLNGAILVGASSLVVTSATGFPASGNFRCLISAEGANTDEIVTVTAVSGTTFTISRATEAIAGVTAASAHGNGAVVTLVLTAGALGAIPALSGPLALTGVITPTALSAGVNNYNPTGLAEASVIRLGSNGAYIITGLAGGYAGRMVRIDNISAYRYILSPESGSSTAANRFTLPAAGNFYFEPQTSVVLVYDGVTSRWLVAAGASTRIFATAGYQVDVADGLSTSMILGSQVYIYSLAAWTLGIGGTTGSQGQMPVAKGDATIAYAPTMPSVGAVSTGVHSTSSQALALPSGHALNDIIIVAIQSSNESIAAPTGFTQLGPQNGLGINASAGATRLGLFWKRDSGSETDPITIADSGDHTYATAISISRCPTTGDPFHFMGNSAKFATSTAGSAAKGATTNDQCLVLAFFAHAIDNASAQASSAANADLDSVTEQFDGSTTDGTGGGIVIVSGGKILAGPFTNTTLTWANTTPDLNTVIAMIPANSYHPTSSPRPVEVQTFIGSTPDLDDTWVKPAGAKRVFAQLCDGGGSGSGGNTTTTAAGGGGGGGGGYDEAWFNANDLSATVTVHAGKGGAVGTALNQIGNKGIVSEFDKGNSGPLTSTSRIAGIAATAAASADGGDGGSGSGRGTVSPAVATTRITLHGAVAGAALGARGGAGGSGTTAPTGGSPAEWGGGGGESGADTDAGIVAGALNGYSLRGGGGGAGGRTNANVSQPGTGGYSLAPSGVQGTAGADSAYLPYGGSGGVNGGSSVVTGGSGGFPGGGGGGGAGVAGGFGGRGGHGCVVVTTTF